MKTPPELTPEYRATLTYLRSQCESFMRRRAALVKKLATENAIEARVQARIAFLKEKVEHRPGDAKSAEELHGRKLQSVLLSHTIDQTRGKLAISIEHGDETMQRARAAVKEALRERFGAKLPPEAELLDATPGADPAEAGRNMVEVLTLLLGDAEERKRAAAEREEQKRQFKAVVAKLEQLDRTGKRPRKTRTAPRV